jgi:hypothetical protein
MRDGIRWICQNKHLIIGTESAEWIIPSGVHATGIQAVLNSRYGSNKIQPAVAGDAVCFFRAGGKSVLEYGIPLQDSYMRASDLALLDKEALAESPAADFDFVSAPYTRLFIVREDGTVVTFLRGGETGVFAWARFRTEGEAVSVAAAPGPSGYDDVFIMVKIGSAFFLERFTPADEREAVKTAPGYPVYLDCHKAWAGDASGYTSKAVVYDEDTKTVYRAGSYPPAASGRWIGYPFESEVTSMPVLANDRMKPNIIKNLSLRLRESGLPVVVSLPNNVETALTGEEPFSGIKKINFPGAFGADVFFRIKHDKPAPCRILAINAEVN